MRIYLVQKYTPWGFGSCFSPLTSPHTSWSAAATRKGNVVLQLTPRNSVSRQNVYKQAHGAFCPQREALEPVEEELVITGSQYTFLNIKLCQSKLIFHKNCFYSVSILYLDNSKISPNLPYDKDEGEKWAESKHIWINTHWEIDPQRRMFLEES